MSNNKRRNEIVWLKSEKIVIGEMLFLLEKLINSCVQSGELEKVEILSQRLNGVAKGDTIEKIKPFLHIQWSKNEMLTLGDIFVKLDLLMYEFIKAKDDKKIKAILPLHDKIHNIYLAATIDDIINE